MSADTLLSRLEKVKRTGPGSWLACCPAHEDRSPSLSVAERDDRVLLHCFAGCSALDVLGAVGLDFADVMPPKPVDTLPPIRRAFPAADVLEALSGEAQYVAIFGAAVREGVEIKPVEWARLSIAIDRINEGRRLANG